jgi:hypothetical protein
MRYKTPLPIAVFAVAAVLSLPATASAFTHIPLPAPIPAPSGEVQYTVTETTFESNETVPGVTPWRRLEESWASATAARNVLTNAEDGQLLSECASTATSYSCFDADDHDLLLNGGSPALDAAGRSWQTAGARIKTLIAAGALRQTGSTTFLGRPAYTFVGTSDEEGHLTVVADAATYYPLEQAVTFIDGAQTGSQVSRVTTFESLSPAAAREDLAPKARALAAASSSRHGRHKRHGRPARHRSAGR